jgi:hypothetical protein
LGYFVERGIPFLEPPKTPFSVLTMLLTSATYPPRNGFKPWIPGWIQRGLGEAGETDDMVSVGSYGLFHPRHVFVIRKTWRGKWSFADDAQ